jgi:hypothetical protein
LQRFRRSYGIALLTLTLLLAGCGSRTVTETRTAVVAKTVPFSPPCAHPNYGADCTMGPVFCVVVNPRARRYYAKLEPRLLALGPNANRKK